MEHSLIIMRHYCTYFDSNYQLMGLALYHSLVEQSREPFTLWVLCFDEAVHTLLSKLNLPHMRLITQADFEQGDDQLVATKENRSKVEYLWTCTPSLPLYILHQQPEVGMITYLDADLYFFSDPEPIYDELGDNSIMILGHRFPAELKDHEPFGLYNVSWLIFRRDENGLAALKRWREQCIDWCYAQPEDGKFGDQKYLDDWPETFAKVVVLQHEGAGLAPWNLSNYMVGVQNGRLLANDADLIFYHFHRFRLAKPNLFKHGTENYARAYTYNYLTTAHVRHIFRPYATKLTELAEKYLGEPKQSTITLSQEEKKQLINGIVFLIRPVFLASWLTSFALWRSQGRWLANQGYQRLQEQQTNAGRRLLLAASLRSPLMVLDKKFRRAIWE